MKRNLGSAKPKFDPNASMPYDSLVSNKGTDRNIYFDRMKGGNLDLGQNPSRMYNSPPWLNEEATTMADERTNIYGKRGRGGMQKNEDEYSRSGLSRDTGKSEFGGMNIFSRKKLREQKERMGLGHHVKKRKTFLEGSTHRRFMG